MDLSCSETTRHDCCVVWGVDDASQQLVGTMDRAMATIINIDMQELLHHHDLRNSVMIN